MAKSRTRKSGKTTFNPGVQGILDVSRHGMGYVTVPNMTVDIVVKKENLKDAMQGDTVEVHIFKISPVSKRPEGVISKVIKRGQQELIGTVDKQMNFAFVIPDNKSFTKDIFVPERNAGAIKTGDRVIVRITDWNPKMKNPEGIIVDVLNDERQSDIAMKQILLENGFNLEFPTEVLQELAALSTEISEEEISKRKDLRETFTLTIDPHDAKDFDDAISFRTLSDKKVEIGVHIADVSHYVQPGTALDQEAFQRATSVYLPDRVLPMLPEKISNELCSLRPKEDKLTFSVIYVMDQKGTIVEEWMGKTIIHSNHRFTYEEVQEIIETKEGLYKEEILFLNNLSQSLRKKRFKQGAINFASEEVRFKLDEHHVPIEVVVKESKECHQLIEELMLLANKSVALFVSKQQKNNQPVPFPYRIHDTPDLDKLLVFSEFAKNYGYHFDLKTPLSIARSFNDMVKDSEVHPEHKVLQALGIRTMAKAVYATDNIGHYGLAFEHYCHFTSPIRRYPDVLVHRVLLQCLERQIHPLQNMNDLCIHCSEKERKAMEAERDGNKYKQVEFIQKHVGEEFEAVITGVTSFGIWAQTTAHRCEGFIGIQQLLEKDDFVFIEEKYALVGRRSKRQIQIGQFIKVQVAAANLVKRQIDFVLIS